MVERINNQKYEININDFIDIGAEVERVLNAIKEKEYGMFNAEELEEKTKLAMRIVEGMNTWQWQHNKGIRLRGDNHIRIEVYELHELQKKIDEMMTVDLYKID